MDSSGKILASPMAAIHFFLAQKLFEDNGEVLILYVTKDAFPFAVIP